MVFIGFIGGPLINVFLRVYFKRINKAIYFRGEWNPNLLRLSCLIIKDSVSHFLLIHQYTMKGRVSLGHSNQVRYSGFDALWRYLYQHCWYLSINCLFSSLVVLAELTLFLLDNFSNINIGTVLFIRYNLYIFMFIFFRTPVKRIYKAFYFRGGWNFFFAGGFL